MDEGGGNGDYIGKGIDETDDPREIKIGDNLTHKMRNAEDNPEEPLDKGKASGKEGGILSAGEKNQQSDKDGASSSENSAGWTNSTGHKGVKAGAVAGAMSAKKQAEKVASKMGIKVAGPISTILIILAMCLGAFMGGSGSLMGSFMGNVQYRLDTLDIAAETRSRQIVFSILSGKNTKKGLWGKFSAHMKKMYSKAGIEIEEKTDGTNVMKYKDSEGDTKAVTGDNYDSTRNDSPEFAKMTTDGEATFNGSTALNHDSMAMEAYKSIGIESRNTLDDVKQGDTPEETKANFDKDAEGELKKATPESMTGDVEGGEKTQVEEDDSELGKKIKYDVLEATHNNIDIDANTDIETEVESAVNKSVKSGVDFSIVSGVANGACQVYNVAMTINRMIKAYEAAQVIHMTMKVFEAIQRMQAGEGGVDTVVDVVANYLTHEKVAKLLLEKDESTTIKSSVLNGAPIAALFGGAKVTSEDPIVKSFVTSPNQFRKIADAADNSTGYKACTATRLAASLIDTVGDVASLGTKKILDYVGGVAISAAISLVVSKIVSIMVPKAVNAFARNLSQFIEGPEGSGAIAWGAELVIKNMEKATGFSVGTNDSLNAYVQEKAKVIAERARYDRNNLSPFDTSSPYTFMGMIMKNLTTASLKTDSIVGNVGQITSIVNNSFISLTPASHAGDAIDEIVTYGDYPEITNLVEDGQERLATAFGTPYYIPDFTTMGENVEDVMWYWDAKGAFDTPYDPVDNPNPSISTGTGIASVKNPIILAIKEGRTPANDVMLAKYSNGGNLADEFVLATAATDDQNELALCMEEKIGRGAELGVPDAEIEQKYSAGSTGSAAVDSILGAVPIVGGILDAVTAVDNLAHLGNIIGFKYHANTKVNHMCERYVLDERLGESMGVYDKAQTTAYLENYRKEHPLDNSMLGIIARFSGLTKEQIVTSIAQVKALMFVAGYNPEGLGPLFYEEPKIEVTFDANEDYGTIVGIIYYSTLSEPKRSQNITA